MRDHRRCDRTVPACSLEQHRNDATPVLGGEPFDGLDGPEDLGQVGADGPEVELDVVAGAGHLVTAHRQTVTVDLETMTQPWLHDAVALLDLGEQSVDVTEQLVGRRRRGASRRPHSGATRRSPVQGRPEAPCDRARRGAARWAACGRPRVQRAAPRSHVRSQNGAQLVGRAGEQANRHRRRRPNPAPDTLDDALMPSAIPMAVAQGPGAMP